MIYKALGHNLRLVCFDLSVYGHHPHYIQHLIKGWQQTQPPGTLYFVVSPEFLTAHADVVDQSRDNPSIQFVAISPQEQNALKPRNSGLNRNLRNFQEWRLFARYAKQLKANHALMLYLDTCLLPMAAGLPFPCPVSGIYFRPTFHYPSFGHHPQNLRDRLQRWREQLILHRALRHPCTRTLLSLDPFAPQYIVSPRPSVSVVPLADPVEVSRRTHTVNTELREQLGVERDRLVFILFGALTDRKGIYTLLESLETLPNEVCQKICLVLLGEASDQNRPRIQAQVSALRKHRPLQILERYEFVEESVLHQHIAMSDVVLALYQKHVGMSGILLQAALHEKPVLSSDYGLMGEIVRCYELGLTVDSTKPAAIVAGITQYVESPATVKVNVQKMEELIYQNSSDIFAKTILESGFFLELSSV